MINGQLQIHPAIWLKLFANSCIRILLSFGVAVQAHAIPATVKRHNRNGEETRLRFVQFARE
jgi:hypothetical protein